jgi:hypothetical protein
VQYFLGPFVYADEDGDRRFLVDGQQRFTTLHLIFLHLLRMAPDDTRPKTRHRLTNAIVAGYDGDQPRFRLDIDERRRAMNALLNGKEFEPRLGDSLTVQNLWRRSEQIREDLAQRIQSDQHARFVDWLLDNVVMVGIEATDRDSGFRIFESMNDRGARLTSVDLMKSFLLSRANRDVEKLNSLWRDMIREATRQRGDADAPKEFLKAYLIGRHANLARPATGCRRADGGSRPARAGRRRTSSRAGAAHCAEPIQGGCRISWSGASPVKSPGTTLVGSGRGRDAGTQHQRLGMGRHRSAARCHESESRPPSRRSWSCR